MDVRDRGRDPLFNSKGPDHGSRSTNSARRSIEDWQELSPAVRGRSFEVITEEALLVDLNSAASFSAFWRPERSRTPPARWWWQPVSEHATAYDDETAVPAAGDQRLRREAHHLSLARVHGVVRMAVPTPARRNVRRDAEVTVGLGDAARLIGCRSTFSRCSILRSCFALVHRRLPWSPM